MTETLQFKDLEGTRKMIKMSGENFASFSKKVKVDPSMMSNYLTGKKFPSPPTAKKIANGLGKDMYDIFFA
ncbi:helix-turn-helix transcriptional regulator [uncultured Fructobacillus sp.]|uniref:helix-turn-helix transcriptional regulator n=1 Tax=uncultured Fructobacillus sp. TaxID=591942 RepID=UPI0025991DE0|nr:helix-turn-helix transcriptional regulator [uncultured Fructobacillus sp.]